MGKVGKTSETNAAAPLEQPSQAGTDAEG